MAHPGRSFSFTELRINSKCTSRLLKQTLKDLDKIEFLNVVAKNKTKYFQMNKHFALFPELVNLLRKVKNVPQDDLAKQALKVGNCRLLALTGVFAGKPRMETDLLFVGKLNSRKLSKFLSLAEKYAEQEVSYTIFTQQEFEYRKIMNDRFVKNILENNPVLVVDRTKKHNLSKLAYNR